MDQGASRGEGAARPLDERGELPPERAVELAEAFVATFLVNDVAPVGGERLAESVEDRHGAAIDFSTATAQLNPIYIQSPVASFAESTSSQLRRWLGSWYLVRFDAGAVEAFSVAVSALATHVDPDRTTGLIDPSSLRGNEFRVMGSRVSSARFPLTLEQATSITRSRTQRNVLRPPSPHRALMPSEYPQLVRWRVLLDAPVDVLVRSTGDEVRTSELFVLSNAPRGVDAVDVVFFIRGTRSRDEMFYYTSEHPPGGLEAPIALQISSGLPVTFLPVDIVSTAPANSGTSPG